MREVMHTTQLKNNKSKMNINQSHESYKYISNYKGTLKVKSEWQSEGPSPQGTGNVKARQVNWLVLCMKGGSQGWMKER